MALGDKADHSARFSFEPAKIGVFVGVKANGQINVEQAFELGLLISQFAWSGMTLLQRAEPYRRCPSVRRGNRERGETIAAKTDRQRNDRALPHRRFDERIGFRCPAG